MNPHLAPTRSAILATYYRLAGLYTLAASLIWGVNTLFLLDAGLTITEVFLANAAFSAGMVLFEIPTGVVADTLGRRASYLLSVSVLAATTVGYLVAARAEAPVGVFAAVSVAMGLGFTFYSGALEAWLVDALATVDDDPHLDHVFARGQQVTGATMLVGTMAGGGLGQLDLALPYLARAGLLVLLGAFALRSMFDIGFATRRVSRAELPAAMVAQARAGITHGWRQPGLRLLVVSGAVHGTFFGWAFYASQPYFLELLERDAVWVVGIVTALMSLSMIAGNQLVDTLSRRCTYRTTLLLWAAAATTVAVVTVGVATSFWLAVPAFLVATGALGVTTPVRQAYMHRVTPSDHRATVVSFDAMIGSTGGVGGQVGLGALADGRGLSAGYVAGGAFTVAALPILWLLRRRGEAADRIVGRAGAEGSCAAAGLPALTQTESVPLEVVTAEA